MTPPPKNLSQADTGSLRWMTVADAVADLGHAVSEDKVRNWCRNGGIEGVINIGDGKKAHYRIPRAGWDKFIEKRKGSLPTPLPASRFRSRAGTNHIGI